MTTWAFDMKSCHPEKLICRRGAKTIIVHLSFRNRGLAYSSIHSRLIKIFLVDLVHMIIPTQLELERFPLYKKILWGVAPCPNPFSLWFYSSLSCANSRVFQRYVNLSFCSIRHSSIHRESRLRIRIMKRVQIICWRLYFSWIEEANDYNRHQVQAIYTKCTIACQYCYCTSIQPESHYNFELIVLDKCGNVKVEQKRQFLGGECLLLPPRSDWNRRYSFGSKTSDYDC